jgi:hypothetical protein
MDLPAAGEAAVAMIPEKPGPRSAKPNDVLAYIAAMAEELATLAKGQRLDALGYILDMARMEADLIARGFGEAEDDVA